MLARGPVVVVSAQKCHKNTLWEGGIALGGARMSLSGVSLGRCSSSNQVLGKFSQKGSLEISDFFVIS